MGWIEVRAAFLAAVGQLQLDEHVVQPHDAQADLAGLLGHLGDLGNGEAVAVDDVVEEADRQPGGGAKALPVDRAVLDVLACCSPYYYYPFLTSYPLFSKSSINALIRGSYPVNDLIIEQVGLSSAISPSQTVNVINPTA